MENCNNEVFTMISNKEKFINKSNLQISTINGNLVAFLGLIKHISAYRQNIKKKFKTTKAKVLILELNINTINNPTSEIELIDRIDAISILKRFFNAFAKFEEILNLEVKTLESSNNQTTKDNNYSAQNITSIDYQSSIITSNTSETANNEKILDCIKPSILKIKEIQKQSNHIFRKAFAANKKDFILEAIISLSISFVQITSAYENYKNDTSEYTENSARGIANALVLLENLIKYLSNFNVTKKKNLSNNHPYKEIPIGNLKKTNFYNTSTTTKKKSTRKKLLILLAKPLFISFWILSNTIVIGSVATGGYFLNALLIKNDLSSKIPNFIRDNHNFIDLYFKNKDFDYFIKNLMPQFNDSEDLMKILNNLNSENKLEFIKHLSDYCKLHEKIQGSDNFLKNFNNLFNKAHKFRIESLLIPIVAASIILAITNVLCYLGYKAVSKKLENIDVSIDSHKIT